MWHNLTEATFNNKRGKLPKVITPLSGCNLKLCQDFTICNSFKVKGWNDGSLSGLYPWQFKYADGGWWGYSWFYAQRWKTRKGLFINDVIIFEGYPAPPPSPSSSFVTFWLPPPLAT